MRVKILILLQFILLSFCTIAQNLEKIGQKDMITIKGGLNFNTIYYNAWGMPLRRDPFSWFLNGNLNISFLDVSLPFTYSYTNYKGSFTQPFNMTSCSPQYKWVKLYIGQTNMNFSSYTLAGHAFAGAGFELTPGHWRISGMYGRLKKEVEYDVINNSDLNMSYRRMGYGIKAGYENSDYAAYLIFFTAKDDPKSLDFIPANSQITPQENTVISSVLKGRITKELTAETELAISGLTRNISNHSDSIPATVNYLPFIFQASATSQFFTAIKTSLQYAKNNFSVAIKYERVAPDYKTLGGYYFNNDMENITVAPTLKILAGKLNFAANSGFQRNNLDQLKLSSTHRWVNSFNVNYVPSSQWIFSMSYSNFSTFTNIRPITDPYYVSTPADTLNFYQVSQNANAMMNHNFGNKNVKQGFSVTGSYQIAKQVSSGNYQSPAKVFNLNSAYSLSLSASGVSIAFMANYNQTDAANTLIQYLGPGINGGKNFNKGKLRTSLGTNYSVSIKDGESNGYVLNNRFSLNYSPKFKNEKLGKPSFSVAAMHMFRSTSVLNELTITANINYAF